MRKQVLILVSGIVLIVMLCAAGGSTTWAWISNRTSAAWKSDGAPGAGGIHVDLDIKAYAVSDSSTDVSSDNVIDSASPYSAIIYPDVMMGSDGVITNGKSGIRYKITNNSGRDVIARVNQKGLKFVDDSTTDPSVSSMELRLYQLKDEFYYEDTTPNPPPGSTGLLLDYDKLFENQFEKYKIADANFYDANSIVFPRGGEGKLGISLNSRITLEKDNQNDNKNVRLINFTDETDGTSNYLFLFIPANKSATFIYEFSIIMGNTPGKLEFDNRYQYAALTLQLTEGSDSSGGHRTDENGNPLLEVYAVEPSRAACDTYFGEIASNVIYQTIGSVLGW